MLLFQSIWISVITFSVCFTKINIIDDVKHEIILACVRFIMSSFHASCKFQMSLGKSISFVVELFAKQVVRIKYLQEMKMDCFDFKAVKIERKICHRALNNFSTFFFFCSNKTYGFTEKWNYIYENVCVSFTYLIL